MKKMTLVFIVFFYMVNQAFSQTPVNMAAQSGLSYTENFSDISNWIFNSLPADGNFVSGSGASAWKGIDVGGVGSIPNGTRITNASTFFQTPGGTFYSSGFYRGSQSVFMISSGTTDNTSSIAIDFFLNFTTVNAGTISFDWASLNNSTGDRKGSLRVYGSIDGVSFTELPLAQVLNFTNNSPTSGSISNIALPANFSGSSSARLRFYYSNGTGGTGGSRPRISLDNIKVTALPTIPCTTPTAQPFGFFTNTVLHNSIQFSFSPASPAPNNYLVVMSSNSLLSSDPVNFYNYNLGDNLGDGTVISITSGNTVTATGLSNSTTYYFFVFSMNNACTGGPLYSNLPAMVGSATTLSGPINCVAPLAQPTSLIFNSISTTSISGTFDAALNTDEYLVIRSLSSTFTGTLNNGTVYNGGNVLGNGTVVTRTSITSFTSSNLISGTQYFFYVFAIQSQNCNNGPAYRTVLPLTSNATTFSLPICVAPIAQPTQLNLTATNNSVNGYFVTTVADGYLVVRSLSTTLSSLPVNGINYVAGNIIGNGTVVSNNTSSSFLDNGLTSITQYYYFVFSRNNICTGTSPMYQTLNPLTANTTTTSSSVYNYYFGNLHAHSSYSDGNVDNTSFTPADNYAYAKNSLCLDFLGISDHNHSGANMLLSNFQPGLNQAAAATSSNFLALYGMEYGVIANGGHVLIYGTNSLIGWENGNYNIYVPKSDYIGSPESTSTTGLFRTINNLNNSGLNAFATFAHPDFADYNNLSNISYNASADSAVVGSAIASGPAFSTNTTYSDPPTSMRYIDFYNKMLSKGYHIGPLMDHDSHNTNFGRSNNNRLAVIAPALNSLNFYGAMKARRFYATEDCDTRVNFTINNEVMGSIISGSNAPAISVYAIDPSNSVATPFIKLMYGTIGTGNLPIQISSMSGNNLFYSDNLIPEGSTGYYYADITIAGNRTITSPIWYTKTGVVPVTLLSFQANLNNNRTVQLHWRTTNEINNKNFIVEKSSNGVEFYSLDSVIAKNQSTINEYFVNDKNPFNGINYYRLKQIDNNGKYSYSKVSSINITKSEINAFSIYPNPIDNLVNLNINSNKSEFATILITDLYGRIVSSNKIELRKGFQTNKINVSYLNAGLYQISLLLKEAQITQKIIKL